MAAAIIPIVTAVLPVLHPFITSLIQHVEGMFGKKQGAAKLDTVVQAVTAAVDNLLKQGILKAPIDVDTVKTIVETILSGLKTTGNLPPTASTSTGVPGSWTGSFTLKQG